MKTISSVYNSYVCEFCGEESTNPDLIRRHESVCCRNPANLDRIKDLAGKVFTDGMGIHVRILSASPGVIKCALIKEILPERHTVIRITECAGPEDLTWVKPCEEDEARQAAERVTGFVKKFLGESRWRRISTFCRSPGRRCSLPHTARWAG